MSATEQPCGSHPERMWREPQEVGRMAEREYDVAIVGGSLAGCAAATLLGRDGRRVAGGCRTGLVHIRPGDRRGRPALSVHAPEGARRPLPPDLRLLDRPPVQPHRETHVLRRGERRAARGPRGCVRRQGDACTEVPGATAIARAVRVHVRPLPRAAEGNMQERPPDAGATRPGSTTGHTPFAATRRGERT